MSRNYEFDEKEIKLLVDELRKVKVESGSGLRSEERKGEYVEPIQLQVVCQRWWEDLRSSSETKTSTLQKWTVDVDKAC